MEILQNVTSLALAMLILSLIVEKLTNFWKLHGPGELKTKQPDPVMEKEREKSIHAASLVTGVLVAFFMKADAIQILRSEQPEQTIGWDLVFRSGTAASPYIESLKLNGSGIGLAAAVLGVLLLAVFLGLMLFGIAFRKRSEPSRRRMPVAVTAAGAVILLAASFTLMMTTGNAASFWPYLSLFVGIVLSGAGMSFGSKFWHDLLGVLFEIGELKKKLRDEKMYEIRSRTELEEFLKLTEEDAVRLALEQHGERLKEKAGVSSVSIGTSTRDGRRVKSLQVHVEGKDTTGLGTTVPVILPSGSRMSVPVEVVEDVGETHALSGPGWALANRSTADRRGSYGCVLKDRRSDDRYVLTCNHVLVDGSSTNPGGKIENGADVITIDRNGAVDSLGKWTYGYRNRLVDIALVRLDPSEGTEPPPFSAERRVTSADVANHTEVTFHGSKSGRQTARVVANEGVTDVIYADGVRVVFKDIISIGREDESGRWRSVSTSGDSGAVVFDPISRTALGIIVAGNERFTYVIPMTSILALLDMEIVS